MRRVLILVLVSVVTVFTTVGCSSKSEESTDSTISESVEEITFTEEELSYLEKPFLEIESKYWDLKAKYEKVSENERLKVKESFERIEIERDAILAEEQAKKEDTTTTEVIERENIIGISDKDFTSLDKSKPTDVRNDTTGNWKLSTVATTENILEYIKSYYKANFSSDKEIHAIVNFTLNTTTQVSKLFDNIMAVTIHEYVDKEEHDANKLFGGMVLGEYWIYLDNGDIEKID